MPTGELYIQEPDRNRRPGFLISKRSVFISGAFIITIFVGSLIGVYKLKSNASNPSCFSNTSSTVPDINPISNCQTLYCQNRLILDDWEQTCPTTSKPVVPKTETFVNYRLPKDLKPYFYEILIKPYFNVTQEPSFYTGHVLINFKCLQNTSKLVFHKHQDIEIDDLSFELKSLSDKNFIPVKKMLESNYLIEKLSYDNLTQLLQIELFKNTFIKNEEYSLSMNFKGLTRADNYGLYRSSYADDSGNTKWLLASQMEPTDARKVFPCFDEPDMKAKFKIRVLHDSSVHVLSNMMPKSSTKIESKDRTGYNWVQTDFYETVEMSSYLVAFVISDFECISKNIDLEYTKNLTIQVCSRPNAKNQLDLAMNASVNVIKFYESYYNISYPLTKLDHVALPDFSAGAMENWGLILYRESRLLYDPVKSSQSSLQAIVEVIAHEIAHQWFGNLVSPSWWTDIWLNEGFARYMQILGAESFQPEWYIQDQIIEVVLNSMELDSLQSSHPISVEVNSTNEIQSMFDGITYGKGGSIIRMTNYFLGESNFKNGLTDYLRKFSYGNAEQNDLWESLKKYSDKNVNLTRILNTWTKQMGYPLIQVQSINKTHLKVTQEHFLYDSSQPVQKSPFGYKWDVPLAFSVEKLTSKAYSNAEKFNVSNIYSIVSWIDSNQDEKIIPLGEELENKSYILANLDAFGFYRVNYDDSNWNLIMKQLLKNHKSIPSRMRSKLVSDIFSLVQANKLPSHKPFEFIQYLNEEYEYLPWFSLFQKLSFFFDNIESTEIYGDFRVFMLNLVESLYNKLGWRDQNTDTWLLRKLRTIIVKLACHLDHQDCIENSIALYKEWMKNEKINKIPVNVRSLVYCTAIKYGTFAEWSFALSQYEKESDASVKRELQAGMACSREQWIQIKYLNNQLNLNKTRKQDGLFGIIYSASNLNSNKLAWNFVKNNWEIIIERYANSLSLSNLVNAVSSKFNTIDEFNDFSSFYAGVDKRSAARQVKISTERIKANINWMSKNFENLKKWFSQNKNYTRIVSVNYRLPNDIEPFFYDIILKVNMKSPSNAYHEPFTFDGLVNINFKCRVPTKKITLHQKDLNIKLFNISSNDVLIKTDDKIEYDFKRDFMTIMMDQPCTKGSNYTLQISYSANLSESLSGFYLSSYVDQYQQINYLATTQFEPTDARRAFPCFDEPSFKSEFKISIVRHKNFSSVSNMPLLQSAQINEDFYIDSFEKSVPMSTYLVAFVVSNFEKIQQLTPKYNITVEVIARPEAIKKGHGEFALKEASQIIDHYSDYFNITYPLKKSTQIAIPDFNAGAMENWGLVTYRERYLLFNPEQDSISNRLFVSVVISHELAHQWFGNLVSPSWWNDLWLNEGFASWVEFLGVNFTHPEWNYLDHFLVEKTSALFKDSLESSHPISTEVNDPNEISYIFDDISYDKGSSLVRMMNSFLSIDTFKKGITNYLNTYQYKNADQSLLFSKLSNQASIEEKLDHNVSLNKIMETWTLKKGYPVVNVQRTVKNYGLTLNISQRWFLLNPLSKILGSKSYNDTKWFVPFTFTAKSNAKFDFESRPNWLDNQSEYRTIDISARSSDWVIGNLKFSGFYRVNYDVENWNLIIKQLYDNHSEIDVVNRAQLIDDSFNLARAEQLDIDIFLSIIKYLSNETSYIPFEVSFNSIKFMDNMLYSNYNLYSKFKKFCLGLYRNAYETIGWSMQTDFANSNLQTLTILSMCFYSDPDCIAKSRELFQNWAFHNITLPKNLKKTILNTISQHGNESEWFYLFERAHESDYQEKIEIFKSLSYTRDYMRLKMLLDLSLNKSVVKSQDEDTLIILVARNPIGKSLVWDFLMKNWDYFNEKTEVPFYLDGLFRQVFKDYNSKFELKKVEEFYKNNANSAVRKA
ncbi:Aminopeptidase N, partial [Brachionus plicatilis]